MAHGKPKDGSKNPGGRPRAYDTPEELHLLVENYFKSCEPQPLINQVTGEPYLDKQGQPIMYGHVPPSVAGLAYALGFKSRQSLFDYADNPMFMDIIMRAKLRIEIYNNTRLYDKDGVQGAKFNLTVNYGYIEKQGLEHSGEVKLPTITIKRAKDDTED
jgi:hypothetical protein